MEVEQEFQRPLKQKVNQVNMSTSKLETNAKISLAERGDN